MSKRKRYSIRDATGSIQIFLKSSCEGAKRPTGGGGGGEGGVLVEGGVPPPTMWSFFVFQCGIVCSGAYFRGDFHIFLHIISVFNWVVGTYCQIEKKNKSLFLEISGNVASLLNWSDWIGNTCHVKFWAFLLWVHGVYAHVPTAHSLHRIPLILSEGFGAMNGQWVRVHTLTKDKWKAQTLTWYAFPIQSNKFCNYSFLTFHPARAAVKQS